MLLCKECKRRLSQRDFNKRQLNKRKNKQQPTCIECLEQLKNGGSTANNGDTAAPASSAAAAEPVAASSSKKSSSGSAAKASTKARALKPSRARPGRGVANKVDAFVHATLTKLARAHATWHSLLANHQFAAFERCAVRYGPLTFRFPLILMHAFSLLGEATSPEEIDQLNRDSWKALVAALKNIHAWCPSYTDAIDELQASLDKLASDEDVYAMFPQLDTLPTKSHVMNVLNNWGFSVSRGHALSGIRVFFSLALVFSRVIPSEAWASLSWPGEVGEASDGTVDPLVHAELVAIRVSVEAEAEAQARAAQEKAVRLAAEAEAARIARIEAEAKAATENDAKAAARDAAAAEAKAVTRAKAAAAAAEEAVTADMKAKAEAEARAAAEADARAKAEAEARAKAEAEAAEAKAAASAAEAKAAAAAAEAEAKAAAKMQAELEVEAQSAAEAKAAAEAEAKAKDFATKNKMCTVCKEVKHKSKFSRSQWSKSSRKCLDCVAQVQLYLNVFKGVRLTNAMNMFSKLSLADAVTAGKAALKAAANEKSPFTIYQRIISSSWDMSQDSTVRSARTDNGYNAMHAAAVSGNVRYVKALADMGVRLDVVSKSGITPLVLAFFNVVTEAGNREAVDVLLTMLELGPKCGGDIHTACIDCGGAKVSLVELAFALFQANLASVLTQYVVAPPLYTEEQSSSLATTVFTTRWAIQLRISIAALRIPVSKLLAKIQVLPDWQTALADCVAQHYELLSTLLTSVESSPAEFQPQPVALAESEYAVDLFVLAFKLTAALAFPHAQLGRADLFSSVVSAGEVTAAEAVAVVMAGLGIAVETMTELPNGANMSIVSRAVISGSPDMVKYILELPGVDLSMTDAFGSPAAFAKGVSMEAEVKDAMLAELSAASASAST
ncbi:uncharacterized protein AMSG_09133 [Thecamonas trahens ATCC 50062]|uniref:Uncharacterized protein n=1 Tax=Thecamonas trahens ATCC 50062 TaxID=461836 RepID=A0A0L0DKX0_THETB|nr:hypothetical protein AMSG_09133 [Thecamonas trahens ATCC 50062]KNC52962.1 hypothetical protein AMSG_09133 [Thecamonas trahens ATCC 50062]|eukprot:XP_013754854.1 hypothetical protein AMSG_09133 [Thecamonas trahens ATCC 50062]